VRVSVGQTSGAAQRCRILDSAREFQFETHKAKLLNLSTDKAFHFLAWKPGHLRRPFEATVVWYRTAKDLARIESADKDLVELTLRQITEFESHATQAGLAWAAADSTGKSAIVGSSS